MLGGTRNSRIEPDIDQALECGHAQEALPYVRLWAATLYGGLRDYAKALEKSYADEHPWKEWVLSDSEDIQSFCWICDMMDMNPIVIRRLATANYKDLLHGSVIKKKRSKDEIQ